jgi:hypothetical protein
LPGSLTERTDRLPAPGELESGYVSVDDTACPMQGFVPERSFTKDRRVIDLRIDSVLMVCGTPNQCYRQIMDFIECTGGLGNLLVVAQAGFLSHADTVGSLT